MATSEEFLNALNEEQLANILDNKDEEDDDVDSSQPSPNKDEDEDDVDSSQSSPPKRLRGSEANANAATKNREKTAWRHFQIFCSNFLETDEREEFQIKDGEGVEQVDLDYLVKNSPKGLLIIDEFAAYLEIYAKGLRNKKRIKYHTADNLLSSVSSSFTSLCFYFYSFTLRLVEIFYY